jgi:uncharacterized paraquat-inducible protein A
METTRKHRKQYKFSFQEKYCICPECGERLPHVPGKRCRSQSCPRCGTKMYREGSFHYQQWLKRNKEKIEE